MGQAVTFALALEATRQQLAQARRVAGRPASYQLQAALDEIAGCLDVIEQEGRLLTNTATSVTGDLAGRVTALERLSHEALVTLSAAATVAQYAKDGAEQMVPLDLITPVINLLETVSSG